jgi:hypothetical protein
VQNTSFMLVNPDITNPIFIGNDPGSQLIAVPPLGSIALSASGHDIWVSTNGGNYTVQAYLLPNGTNWTPSPAQVAAQIGALNLARETGGNLAATEAAAASTAVSVPALGTTVPQGMLHGGQGVTTEIAALVASGQFNGTPGGVPLLRRAVLLGSAAGLNLPANANTVILANTSVPQPSYEAGFSLNLPAGAGTVPFANINFFWIDPASGNVLDNEWFNIPAGNGAANPITTYVSGPARAGTLQIQVNNMDPAQAMTLTWSIYHTGQVFTRDRLLQPFYAAAAAPIGFTNPAGIPAAGLLAAMAPVLGPLATTSRLVAAWNGITKLGIDNSAQANAVKVSLQDPANTFSSLAGTTLFTQVVAAAATSYFEITFPNGPLLLSERNQGASGNISPTVTLTKQEY